MARLKDPEKITITINNWSKFNPRRDVLKSSWFRLDHGIFEDPKFYDLKPEEWGGLLYILTQASKTNSGTFPVHFGHALRVGQMSSSYLMGVIKKLQSSQFVHVDVTCTNADVTSTCSTYERNERSEHNETDKHLVSNTEQQKRLNQHLKKEETVVVSSNQFSDTTLLWVYYSEKLKITNGIEAVKSAKTNTLCKQLVQNLGLEKAKKLVDVFLSDDDAFIRNQAWPIGLLVSQQQKYLSRIKSVKPFNFI